MHKQTKSPFDNKSNKSNQIESKMDAEMQQKCDNKLQELQQSMPFLLKVLERLRNNNINDPARQTQLDKIQKLYNLLNDRSQTFKWELLVKCENVVTKLQRKMELQGETEFILRNSHSPIQKQNESTKETKKNKMTQEDLECPESPPPQQEEEFFDKRQPVVIPTERRCSPPPILSRNRENYEASRSSHHDERKDGKHKSSHRRHDHHHRDHHHRHDHHQHSHHKHHHSSEKRRSSRDRRSFDLSRDQNSSERSSHSSTKSSRIYDDVNIDQYLSMQRKRMEENKNSSYSQRRSDNYNIPFESPNAYEKHETSPTRRRHNIFSRLGEKVSDGGSDDYVNDESFNRNQNTMISTSVKLSQTLPLMQTPLKITKITANVPDFLKSPPLSANDITQLLNEANTNSNSNSNSMSNSSDILGISDIGTRRSAPSNSIVNKKPTQTSNDSNSNLDFVRKKFALLTKNEINSASATTTSSNASTFQITPTLSSPPSERIALKYAPHSRGDSSATSKSTSNLVMPNSNVNVLPTLRPNDPRLRKCSNIANGNTLSNLLSNNNNPPNLNLRQAPAANSFQLTPTISDYSIAPNTPSPIYGSTTTTISGIPSATKPTSQIKINDPRLQRNKTPFNSTHTQRPLLVSADSSDENWDCDDNANDNVFPQPRPFPNRNSTYSVEHTSIHYSANNNATALTQRRQSFAWDNVVSPTNNNCLKNSLQHQEEANSFLHSNWHGVPATSPSLVKPFNDRFGTLQNNASNEKSSYSIARTYGAYKEARARAAAEEAAKRTPQEAKIPNQIIEIEDHATDVATNNVSGLNTKYRNNNLTDRELPKSVESFKIPKKGAVTAAAADNSFEKLNKGTSDKKDETKSCEKVIEQKVEKQIEQKVEKKIEQKVEKKIEQKVEKKIEKKVEKKIEQKVEKQIEKKVEKQIGKPKEKVVDKIVPEETDLSRKENETNKHVDVMDSLQPKPQRERFREKKKLSTTLNLNKDPRVSSPKTTVLPKTQTPGRILRRRATMIDKASAPEVDKEKLRQCNAMLFEDLQERERKKETEETDIKMHANNRRNKEISFEKTDDGCTVSTQNIITGKRRTRTTANFNEVQRGIAVFKHLKTNEQKKDAVSSTPSQVLSKDRKKPGPKSKIKPVIKTEPEIEKAADKSKPGKESASKTRKRRGTQVDSEIKLKIKKEPVEVLEKSENEEKKEKLTDVLPNVNSIFDTFIQKIIQPSGNADDLIDKLRDILSEQEVESLLSIRESMIKKNSHDSSSKDVDISNEKVQDTSKALNDTKSGKASLDTALNDTESDQQKQEPQPDASHMRPKGRKRNELDRLHEDIRDMFISEGVLTATGKRMCTFVEPCSSKTPECDKGNTDIESKSNSSATTAQPAASMVAQRKFLPYMRKSRVLLPTLRMTKRSSHRQQAQQSQQDSAEESDENLNINENSCSNASFSSDTTQVSSNTGANFSTVSSVNTDITTLSNCSFTKSDNEPLLRRMPILKPVKPIRLREEDELDEWLAKQKGPIAVVAASTSKLMKAEKSNKLQKRYRPCPKSKKPAALLDDDDEHENKDKDKDEASDNANANDDNIENTGIDDEKKAKDYESSAQKEPKDAEIASGNQKIKTEVLDISVPFEVIQSSSIKDSKSPPKNINPKWHWMSRYSQNCVICKKKVMHISPHYKQCHSDHYVSRLAPSVLHALKQESSTFNRPILKFTSKKKAMTTFFLSRCPFCFQFKYTSSVGWLEHFIMHTGEYSYECRVCHKCFNKPALIERHMKDKCAALGGRYLHNDEFTKSFKCNAIKAYVCHLCNYLRLGRVSLERHYMEQHDYDVKSINDSIGYTINLIKADDVPKAQTLEELVEMEMKLNQQMKSDIICLSDVDDTTDVEDDDRYKPKQKKQQSNHNVDLKKAKAAKKVEKSEANKNELEIPIYIKENMATDGNTSEIQIPSVKVIKEKPTNIKPTEIVIQSADANSSVKGNNTSETRKANTLAAPPSSVFLSTTDDSNDDEAPTVFARKLLTVDSETDICTHSSPKPRLCGNISMAERLSQRLKEAEANTAHNLAKKCSKEVETIGPANPSKQSEEETYLPENTEKSQNNDDNADESVQNLYDSDPLSIVKETEATSSVNQVSQETSKDTSETAAEIAEKSDDEIDLTIEEDDDGWEDIEIFETAPNSVAHSSSSSNQNTKDSKIQKTKKNRLQKLTRFYANIAPSTKLTKKLTTFKPLLNIFSNSLDTSEKDSEGKFEETIKKATIENEVNLPAVSTDETMSTSGVNTATTSITNTEPIATVSSSSPVLGFRPMIANLEDLLPDSPCHDPIEIAPELAPSGPLKELSDITTFLGTNLSGLMDIDVEEPANSVCIHNTDNQQTSIQEALDFVASQETEYGVDANLNPPLELNSATTDCLNFGGMNRIQNIGYTYADNNNPDKSNLVYRFYCFSDRCTFLYSSEAIGLENHFLLEHPQSRWNGYCNTCALQVKVKENEPPTCELTFSDEFKHLLDKHIMIRLEPQVDNDILTAATVLQNKPNCISTAEQQPRLKLRRLSGDCLSSSVSLQAELASPSSNLMETLMNDSNSFSDLIQFNPRETPPLSTENLVESIVPTTIESLPGDVPYFTNVSKDFQITSISSGLEPTEISALVKSALNAEAPNPKKLDTPNTSNLQISSVISLANNSSATGIAKNVSTKKTAIEPSRLPKISNVCSLSKNLPTKKIGANWAQQINDERAELEHSLTDSLEVSTILANNHMQKSNRTESEQRDIDNESPGPMIVSETLPTGQAMSGNFVITQTVSAQYAGETTLGGANKPKLGFNISISSAALKNATTFGTNPKTSKTTPAATATATVIAKTSTKSVENNSKTNKNSFTCMEPTCKFTTRHLVATIDHIKWHEQKNDPSKREYLRCSECKLKLSNSEEYTNHIRSEHFSGVDSPTLTVIEQKLSEKTLTSPTPAASCAITQKIRNILCKNPVDVSGTEGSVLKDMLRGPKKSVDDENAAFKARLLKTVKEIVAKTGVCDNNLYRCLVKNCNVKLKESSYHVHVLYHLSTLSGANNTFPCPHCKGKCQNISALKTHIKTHRRHHIFCYVCMETVATDSQMSRHFAQKHWHKQELSKNVLVHEKSHTGSLVPYYVTNLTPLNENNVRDFGKKLIIEWQRKQAASRTHFNPDEVDLLPIQAIFSKDIYCSLCLYKTKVRTNMVRHMSQHKNMTTSSDGALGGYANTMNNQGDGGNADERNVNTMLVCSMDPVNPVPCLISNEKHFDRMTNLASSSLGPQSLNSASGGINSNNSTTPLGVCRLRYTYIPESKRYQCGVPGCKYLTICEEMFRSHLHALHSEERLYQCIFCGEELCKRSIAAERIVQHLRFHDHTLYQCEICDHSHYIRHIVDRHALEKHGFVQRANVLMFIREEEGCLEGTKKVYVVYGKKKDFKTNSSVSDGSQNFLGGAYVENNASNDVNSAKDERKIPKYICNICDHKTITHNQIVSHANSQHGIKKPYQCPYCLVFTEWSEANVQEHINQEHPGEIVEVNRVFGKMSPAQISKIENMLEDSPKPLWQRDDPTRARQIRGIPMEDEEESEKLRKRLRLSEDYYDEDGEGSNDSTPAKARGRPSSSYFLNRFEFGCFHCEFKTKKVDELKNIHWESTHNNRDVLTSKPFLFRLLGRLKCAECQSFTGCFWELQKHMTEGHAQPTSHALDPRSKKLVCGYCDYDCSSTLQLLRHHLRDDHQPQDIKGLFSPQMAKVLRLDCLNPVMYVHCTLCSELFNSRLAVVQHAGERHAEDTEHFSFRELSNTTIYRCSDCFYTSTDEITTLRHMVNHYRSFKRCHFCNLVQSSFNDYMQHCYSEHRSEIKRFSEIYPLNDIKQYLMQIFIIFPNGWIINKKNLRNTPYGNEERIKLIYAEICKTSQEPPIPRLSLGRLVARMSIEAKQQNHEAKSTDDIQLPERSINTSSKKQLNAQKISKRRSTCAAANLADLTQQNDSKRLKISTQTETTDYSEPICTSVMPENNRELIPYSFYGLKPEKEDWSKLHTKISIAGVNTPISLDKFKLLFKVGAYVLLEKIDIKNHELPSHSASSENDHSSHNMQNDFKNVKKACPASQKYRFI